MKRFLQMSRAPFFTAVITPMLLGSALAYRALGSLDWIRFALTLIGLVAAHAGANLLNDYFDARLGADRDNPHRNPFSGGSPHIVEGTEPAAAFLRAAAVSLAAAAACGGWLAWLVDRGPGPVLWLALVGGVLGVFYTAPPLKLSYRGLGEITIFLCFGPLPVMGTYYVQTGRMHLLPVFVSLPLSLMITNIIWINEFPDCAPDAAAGKRHLVVRLGLRRARYVYHAMSVCAYMLIAFLGSPLVLGRWFYLAFLSLPLAACASVMLHRRFEDPPALLPAQGLTVAVHLLTGLAMCAGVLPG